MRRIVVLAILLSCLFTASAAAREDAESSQAGESQSTEVEYPKVSLLLVVDKSGSMFLKSEEIKDLIKLIGRILTEEKIVDRPELLVFDCKANIIPFSELKNVTFCGGTCVLEGVEAAEQWLETKRQGGIIRPGILLISDLYMTYDSEGNPYTAGEAIKVQSNLDEITKEWKQKIDAGELSYLCVTWDSLDPSVDINATAEKFLEYGDGDIVSGMQCLLKDGRQLKLPTEKMEADMAMEAIQQVMELLTGQEAQWIRLKKTGKQGIATVEAGDSYKTFLLVRTDGEETETKVIDRETGEEIPVFWNFGNDNLYLISGPGRRMYKIDTKAKGDVVFVLEIPDLKLVSRFDQVTRYEGEPFHVKARFMAGKDDVRLNSVKDGLWLRVMGDQGEMVLEKEMESDGSQYSAQLELRKSGEYSILIFSASDKEEPLISFKCPVKERRNEETDVQYSEAAAEISEQKEGNNWFGAAAAVVALLLLVAFFRKRRG